MPSLPLTCFTVNEAGRFSLEPHVAPPPAKKCDDYDLHFATYGTGSLLIDGKRHPMAPGDVVIVRPGESFMAIAETTRLDRFYIHFDAWEFPGNGNVPKKKWGAPGRRFIAAEMDEAQRLCADIVRDFHSNNSASRSLCVAHMSHLMRLLIARNASAARSLSPQLARRLESLNTVKCHIERHCRDRIASPELTRIACLSENHLLRLFKAHTGLSPHQYQLKCRIDQAHQLLIAGGMTISEVAEKVGYAGIHKFSDAFKKWTGIRPREYLARILRNGDFG